MLDEDEIRASRASPRLEEQLDLVVSHGVLHRHVTQLKIWNPDGTLFYSSSSDNNAEGEGKLFAELRRAFSGEVVISSTAEPKHFYSGDEIDQGLIEIYAPLVEDAEGTVRLVGEFYETPGFILTEMAQARWRTALFVLAFSLPLLGGLYYIVRRGSLVIDRQHLAMWDGLRGALELAKQNERLRYDAESTRREAGKLNEKVLDQIGWELHDGPIQTLTLIGLSLSDLVASQGQAPEIRIASSSLKDLDTL
ncbi:MAG: ATP-binding protein, partial [Pseudorhizobium sp.]